VSPTASVWVSGFGRPEALRSGESTATTQPRPSLGRSAVVPVSVHTTNKTQTTQPTQTEKDRTVPEPVWARAGCLGSARRAVWVGWTRLGWLGGFAEFSGLPEAGLHAGLRRARLKDLQRSFRT